MAESSKTRRKLLPYNQVKEMAFYRGLIFLTESDSFFIIFGTFFLSTKEFQKMQKINGGYFIWWRERRGGRGVGKYTYPSPTHYFSSMCISLFTILFLRYQRLLHLCHNRR